MSKIKISRNEMFQLKGFLKKNGFDRWRIVTSGFSSATGEEKVFFIEFYIVNPSLSPKEVLLGFKSRMAKSEEELQYLLAGTQEAKTAGQELFVKPSFVMVKAGALGKEGKHINSYFPFAETEFNKADIILRAGLGTEKECSLADSWTKGAVSVRYSELAEKPELLCNSGFMTWDLHYEKKISFKPDYKGKTVSWSCYGALTDFSGSITLDGEEYTVNSSGYIDKNWGKEFNSPFFHLSSVNMVSLISGKQFDSSCFAVQGEYENSLGILVSIEQNRVEFHPDGSKKYSVKYECNETPEDQEGVKLHWTCSVSDRKYVLDVDVYCPTDSMFVRDYECPSGGRKVLKVLGGGSGRGELRLYKKRGKNLELLEHASLSKCLCEYGNMEFPEK